MNQIVNVQNFSDDAKITFKDKFKDVANVELGSVGDLLVDKTTKRMSVLGHTFDVGVLTRGYKAPMPSLVVAANRGIYSSRFDANELVFGSRNPISLMGQNIYKRSFYPTLLKMAKEKIRFVTEEESPNKVYEIYHVTLHTKGIVTSLTATYYTNLQDVTRSIRTGKKIEYSTEVRQVELLSDGTLSFTGNRSLQGFDEFLVASTITGWGEIMTVM